MFVSQLLESEGDAVRMSQLLQLLDDWKQRWSFGNADRAARMHLYAASISARLRLRQKAAKYVGEGLAYKPRNEEVLNGLQELSRAFSGEAGTGTGFVVAPGYVLTNHHVVEGSSAVKIQLPGSGKVRVDARVVAKDAERDMALLTVSDRSVQRLKPLPLANTRVNRGMRVATFGFPLGDVAGSGLKLTQGVVSALPEDSEDGMVLLDCRINPGNSGGPLFSRRGQVIGMVTAKIGGVGVDSYGMALPADFLVDFLTRHLPGFSPVELDGTEREWDEVDSQVSGSILMVVAFE